MQNLWGISEALKIALKERLLGKLGKLRFIQNLKWRSNNSKDRKIMQAQALKIQIFKRAKKLHTYGKELIVRWIPSHQAIPGKRTSG